MKFRMLLVAVGLLALASLSFGQGFTAYLSSVTPIYTTCTGSTPIPDGTEIRIYLDANNNMLPDDNVQPVACSSNCPAGTVSIDHFYVNSVDAGQDPGTFYYFDAFISWGGQMLPINSFFLRVAYPDFTNPQVIWTSQVLHIPSADPIELVFGGWTCETEVQPCNPTQNVFLQPNNPNFPGQQNVIACATLCNNFPVTVTVGPIPLQDQQPHIVVLPGCSPLNTPCDQQCTPAGGILPFVWTFDPVAHVYTTVIALMPGVAEGCVCIHLDYVLPVNFQNISANIGDNSVSVNWTMANDQSEIARYEVVRNDAKIADVSKSSSRDYSYTDTRAINGTSYNYKVVAIGTDGSRHESEVVSATPNPMAAVITEYALHQNYPNPFNPNTQIIFDVKNAGFVTLKVYNAMGQEVANLFNGMGESGKRYSVNFDASNLTSGLYFYTVKIGNEFSATKKMLLVK